MRTRARTEYSVRWKREDCRAKRRIFQTRRGAENFMLLLGPTPWEAYGRDPDKLFCCSGDYCMCGGQTVRENSDNVRRNMPRLDFAILERRDVGEWCAE